MCVVAQCENEVTISEPLGHAQSEGETPMGSKTPLQTRILMYAREFLAPMPAYFDTQVISYPNSFNEIASTCSRTAKRRARMKHYPCSGPCFATLSGWFGPNFVTILASGVRVCST